MIGSIPVRHPGYVHSFGMTERYLILAVGPHLVDPLRMLRSGRPFIENYEWKPDRGSRFLIIDRQAGRLHATVEAEAFFTFHQANAFEELRRHVLRRGQAFLKVSAPGRERIREGEHAVDIAPVLLDLEMADPAIVVHQSHGFFTPGKLVYRVVDDARLEQVMTFFENVCRDFDRIADNPLDRPAAPVDLGLDILDGNRRVRIKWRQRRQSRFLGGQGPPGRSSAVGRRRAAPYLAVGAARRLTRARGSFSGARANAAAVRGSRIHLHQASLSGRHGACHQINL
jgi:hypothetical protein